MQKFMEEKVMPIANIISQNKYLKALSGGMMSVLSIMMVGAFFTILGNIPIDVYKEFLVQYNLDKVFTLAKNMTTEVIGIYMAFLVGKSFAVLHGHKEHSTSIGLLTVMSFLILLPVSNFEGGNYLSLTYLGSQGMFVALICGIITPFVYKVVINRGWKITLPEGVPYNVASSFNNIIPAVMIAIVFLIINAIFASTGAGNAFSFIYSLLQAPLQAVTGNIGTLLLLVLVSQVLWFFGIHGSMTVLPVIFPMWMAMTAENMSSYAANGTIANPINVAFFDYATIGGCGATLGLAILMFFFSKSKQYKAYGKLFLPCGIFNINEPMVFSMPLMLNPIMLIPFILSPIIAVLLGYVSICVLGIVEPPIGIMNMAYVPVIFRGIFQGSVSQAILEVTIVLSSVVIYLPFFKYLDKKAYKLEQEGNK